MSAYIKLATYEYPLFQGDIRLEYPEIGDNFICPNTYELVEYVDPPSCNPKTEIVVEGKPVKNDNKWVMNWIVRPLTQEELDARKLLEERIKSSMPKPQDLTKSGTAPDVIG